MQIRCKNSQANLRMVFDDVTRRDPNAYHISFSECESSMNRDRRTIQPKIPETANEFIDMLPTTQYMDNFKFAARFGDQIAAVFYSEQMSMFLAEITTCNLREVFHGPQTIFSIMDYICFSWVSQFTSNPLLNEIEKSRFIQSSFGKNCE